MTTGHRIPSRLFLRAGRSVERALRKETSDAIAQFRRDAEIIATWEADKVVLLHGARALGLRRAAPGAAILPDASAAARARNESRALLRDLMLKVAQNAYLKGRELYIEFPVSEQGIGELLTRMGNEHLLRDICRELTGREIATHVSFVEEPEDAKRRGPDRDILLEHQLRRILAELNVAGDLSLARQVRRVLLGRTLQLPLDLLPHAPVVPTQARALRERPLVRPAAGKESELAPSHKSEE